MATAERALGRLPAELPAERGLRSWLATVDHKRIGILYLVTSFVFFAVAGVEALLMRTQLIQPGNRLIGPGLFDQLLTMHGTTMLFFAVLPMETAYFNYMMPIMIGARDVAFPRLNALSYWLYLAGGLFLYSSWFLGGAPDAGWFNYAPLAGAYAGPGEDFYLLGLLISGLSSIVSSVNLVVTVLRMRAPGMTLLRVPVFAWASLITGLLILFAMPPFTVAMILLLLDRWAGSGFFVPAMGGNALLWQHLFWIMGHPEVYILAVPAWGVISEVIPTFARKPLFGYRGTVVALFAIAAISFTVWSHHMYATGMGPVVNDAFMITTKLVSWPTAALVFTWLATLWGGRIRYTAAMLYAVGFLPVFIVGGLTGLMLATAPADLQLTDTYFVVGHFHYVAVGGILFSMLAAAYYWLPKMTGRMLDERLGTWSFWITFAGFNLTFFPMLLSGLYGMSRRIYTYPSELGVGTYNLLSTVGAYILGAGVLMTVGNMLWSLFRGAEAGADPWDGRTLEWSVPSPVPVYNFVRIPVVRGRDAHWLAKRAAEEPTRPAGGEGAGLIRLPSPTLLPLLLAAGVLILAYGGFFRQFPLALAGAALTVYSLFRQMFEADHGYLVEVGPSEEAGTLSHG
ncbi:MAG: cytochrome c oxidase subunit I [Clostridia bacterium]|nr:cytochrome c oxidase subunit I [Clostridia bacterium]MCL6522338.1 cytochrome c oxidase subunit I [Bacillota bacterium]